MAALRHDLFCEQGATFGFVYTYKDGAGAAIDLTGFTARMAIRRGFSGAIEQSLTTENGMIALGGAAGTVTLSLASSVTAAFRTDAQDARTSAMLAAQSQSGLAHALLNQRGPLDPKPTCFAYDLEIVSPAGVVTRLLQGRFQLAPEVTE